MLSALREGTVGPVHGEAHAEATWAGAETALDDLCVAIPTFREELDCEGLEVGPPITIGDCEPAEHRESAGGGACG